MINGQIQLKANALGLTIKEDRNGYRIINTKNRRLIARHLTSEKLCLKLAIKSGATKSVVSETVKQELRETEHCGDEIARTIFHQKTYNGLTIEQLCKANGLDYSAWSHLSPGLMSMTVANKLRTILRGKRDRRGRTKQEPLPVVIGESVIRP